MKNIKLVIFLCFLYTNSYAQSEECKENARSMYWEAKIDITIYKSNSYESEEMGKIPKGEIVILLSGGMFERRLQQICYNGKVGWVSSLTNFSLFASDKDSYNAKIKHQIPSSNYQIPQLNTPQSYSTEEIEITPFIGKTTTNLNLRSEPDTKSTVLKQLAVGSMVYLFSETDVNGYLKGIDVATSKIGWLHKKYIRKTDKAPISQTSPFTSTGHTSSYNSEVRLENQSLYTITLIVGNETFYLSPNSDKTVYIRPTKHQYIGTAPGVIPTSGNQEFEPNHGYIWTFTVTSR